MGFIPDSCANGSRIVHDGTDRGGPIIASRSEIWGRFFAFSQNPDDVHFTVVCCGVHLRVIIRQKLISIYKNILEKMSVAAADA